MPANPPAPLVVETIDPIALEPDRSELMRYLGYSAIAARKKRLPDDIERALNHGREQLRPRGTYCIYRRDECPPEQISLGGVALVGRVAAFLRPATRIAAFVVTVGQGISELSREATAAGDVATSWALDALGSWAAEATVQALMTQIQRHLDSSEVLTARYSPGYCGMSLDQQAALFRLVYAPLLGVSLLPSMLMQPLKSISGLVGIGDRALNEPVGVPCRTCTAELCTMRR